MSAQAGVFYFDGRPVDRDLVASIGRSLDAFGPDRAGDHVAPGLAMVHRALHVTPEDRLEQQPFSSPRGNVMTWDGRLDNRDDLILQLWHDLDDNTTDVALALAVYDKWGPGGFAKLIGDWSLVVFDADKRAVVLASDYMGIRPLHYYLRHDSVWWSTTLRCLVELHQLVDDIDQRFIAGYLGPGIPPEITPYRGVIAARTAHSVTVAAHGNVSTSRFWDFCPSDIRCATSDEYESELRDIFMESVRARLRTSEPAWAQLSGGLDSSCVVCAADILIRQGRAVARDLRTISYVTDGSPETDERRFVICVEEQLGRTGHHIQLDGERNIGDGEGWWVTPVHPTGSLLATYRLLTRTGGRVLITGVGGDSVMGNCLDYIYDVAALLQRGRPGAAIKLAWRRALAAQRTLIDVMCEAGLELLPERGLASRRLAQLLVLSGGSAPASVANVADVFLLTPEFAEWLREEWFKQMARILKFPEMSQRRPVGELMYVADTRRTQPPSEESGVCMSHPYLDRRLVQFMIGVPIGVVAPPGQPRGLMRRAFAPFVPNRIISRFSKGYASPLIRRNFREIVSQWLDRPDELRITRLGCIDRTRLVRHLELLRDNSGAGIDLLDRLFKLEQWLRSREYRLHQHNLLDLTTEGR